MCNDVKVNYRFRVNNLLTGSVAEQLGTDLELWQEMRRMERKINQKIREVQKDE